MSPKRPANRSSAKGSRKRRDKGAGGGRSRLWGGVLGVAVVLIAGGIGALKWTETRQGKAALLSLGSQKMFAEVQAEVDAALAASLDGFTPGPVPSRVPAGWEAAHSLDHDWPAPRLGPDATVRCRAVAVPTGRTWWEIQADVAAAVGEAGARVLWGRRLEPTRKRRGGPVPDEEKDLLRLDIGVEGRPTHTLVLYRRDQRPMLRWGEAAGSSAWNLLRGDDGPVVALLIDDWGFGDSAATRELLQLPIPLTMAILPGLPYSRFFALKGTDLVLPQEARPRGLPGADGGRDLRLAAGCFVEVAPGATDVALPSRRREIFLHLPMEPQGYPDPDPGPDAIMAGMDENTILTRLDGALQGLTTVTGVNNHMGSAATADQPTMAALMRILGRKDLLFVDSLTSSRSVAYAEARKAGLGAARNRIFLDYDNENPDTIAANLEVLVRSARATGYAVGIGHPHAATAAVLSREVPRHRKAGVRFVTVSELVALRDRNGGKGG